MSEQFGIGAHEIAAINARLFSAGQCAVTDAIHVFFENDARKCERVLYCCIQITALGHELDSLVVEITRKNSANQDVLKFVFASLRLAVSVGAVARTARKLASMASTRRWSGSLALQRPAVASLTDLVQALLNDAVRSFWSLENFPASSPTKQAERLEELYNRTNEWLSADLAKKPTSFALISELMLFASALYRIGDQALHIAEIGFRGTEGDHDTLNAIDTHSENNR